MADIVECPNCRRLIEWPSLIYWLDLDTYKIGCIYCSEVGEKLVGDYR